MEGAKMKIVKKEFINSNDTVIVWQIKLFNKYYLLREKIIYNEV